MEDRINEILLDCKMRRIGVLDELTWYANKESWETTNAQLSKLFILNKMIYFIERLPDADFNIEELLNNL